MNEAQIPGLIGLGDFHDANADQIRTAQLRFFQSLVTPRRHDHRDGIATADLQFHFQLTTFRRQMMSIQMNLRNQQRHTFRADVPRVPLQSLRATV